MPRSIFLVHASLCWAVALLLPVSAAAQWVMQGQDETPPPADMEAVLAQFAQPDAPGAAIAVVKAGAVVYTGAFGQANLAYDQPITPTTVFDAASVSKQFTAFAIALLADQGRLSLDDDLRQHLPEVPDLGATITIRHLLHHMSGLRDELGQLRLAGYRLGDAITQDDVLRLVSRMEELDQTPGTRHVYSNTNYTLLASIVERVTGTAFADWTEANIFEPLGMAQTQFVDRPTTIVPQQAVAYQQDESGAITEASSLGYSVGAGNLHTTVLDLAQWAGNLQTGRVGGRRVQEMMRTVGVQNDGEATTYAFGLVHGDDAGRPTLGHGGGAPGIQSLLRLYPEEDMAVLILSNAGGSLLDLGALTGHVVRLHVPAREQVLPASSGAPRMIMITEDDLNAEVEAPFDADPATFDAYVGTYQLLEGEGLLGRPMLITKEGDQLRLAFGEPPGMLLIPIAAHRFKLIPLNNEVTFQLDDGGAATGLIFHFTEASFGAEDGPEDFPGVKLDDRTPTAAEWAAYAGTYYSRELDTWYRLSVADGGLVISHARHGRIPLQRLARNEFLADTKIFTTVQFQRDAQGAVTSLYLRGYSWSSGATFERLPLP